MSPPRFARPVRTAALRARRTLRRTLRRVRHRAAPVLAIALIASLGTAGPALAAENGWIPFGKTLGSLVPVCAALGIVLGAAVAAAASWNADGKELGWKMAGGSFGGLILALLAYDLAALFIPG